MCLKIQTPSSLLSFFPLSPNQKTVKKTKQNPKESQETKQNLAHNQSQSQMVATPETPAVSFRAPPPSPVAPGRRSPFANEDVLNEYLDQSLTVPDLILPDRAFPKQNSVQNPPRIDLQNLGWPENESGEEIYELIEKTGCLEVINHGISRDLIKMVLFLAAGLFEISPEAKKKAAARNHGFLEFAGVDEITGESEEFMWCDEEGLRLKMEGAWPHGYSNFSQEMEKLCWHIEEVGTKIMRFLEKRWSQERRDQELPRKFCYIQKQRPERSENSLRHDVIGILICGSEFPHALCLHVCSGSTEFHVYSKRGWLSFSPDQDSIVVTVGDELQGHKHVIGRPVFKGKNERCISMSFLLSHSSLRAPAISVNQQIILGVLVIAIYQFLIYIYCLLFKR